MISVKATREGLVGQLTASGYTIDRVVPYVALPSTNALRSFVHITNPLNRKSCLAIVLDVGPWNEHDDAYVFGGARPLAESNPKTNGAGIDLGEAVWIALGMADNTAVEWEFILA